MFGRKFLFILLSTLFLGSGCVLSGGQSGSSQDIRQQVARHDQQIQSILAQVGQVETALPGQAEMWSQLQSMRQELNQTYARLEDSQGSGAMGRLSERVERLEALVRKIASQLAISAESLDAPLTYSSPSQLSSPLAPAGAYTAQPPIPGSSGAVVIVNHGQEPSSGGSGVSGGIGKLTGDSTTDLYDAGIKSFDQRRYKDAVVFFKDFAAQNPQSKLAGNAYFWQGESYFQMKDYPRAAVAYQDVITKFPKGSKLQSAMLKQGIAFYHANKKEASKERLEELVKRYPNSPEAGRAKKFLKENK